VTWKHHEAPGIDSFEKLITYFNVLNEFFLQGKATQQVNVFPALFVLLFVTVWTRSFNKICGFANFHKNHSIFLEAGLEGMRSL
jgi:hypothetical protein